MDEHQRFDDSAEEFVGDSCVVLPREFFQSADAAVELYEDRLAEVGLDLEVDGLRPSRVRRVAWRALLGALLWLGASPWVVCF